VTIGEILNHVYRGTACFESVGVGVGRGISVGSGVGVMVDVGSGVDVDVGVGVAVGSGVAAAQPLTAIEIISTNEQRRMVWVFRCRFITFVISLIFLSLAAYSSALIPTGNECLSYLWTSDKPRHSGT